MSTRASPLPGPGGASRLSRQAGGAASAPRDGAKQHADDPCVPPPSPNLRWHQADLLAPATADRLARELQPTHLLHLAWYTRPGAVWTAAENLDWVQASLRLLRAFGEAGGARALLAGSCNEYAWARSTHCVEEPPAPGDTGAVHASPLRPTTLYGAAKHALHIVAERWALQAGISLAWARIFYAYGPAEHPARLASGVVRALLRGEPALCTSGTQVRDYLYAADLGRALAALLLAPEVTGAVNVASGEPLPVADLVLALARAVGRPELVALGARPRRPGDPDRLTASVRRLREEVGWRPTVDLADGAMRTVQWWRAAAGVGDN